jgi:hypothetical protein
MNLKMLTTWGASVGGLVLPLDNYIRNGNFDLTDDQRYLVLAGIAFIIFFENKRGLDKVLEKIKSEGLEETFKIVLEKAKNLKDSFKGFLSSINVTVGSFLDTVAYSFLIPIIVDIQSAAIRSSDLKETSLIIAERLVASGVVIVTSKVLSSVIKKIIERIR